MKQLFTAAIAIVFCACGTGHEESPPPQPSAEHETAPPPESSTEHETPPPPEPSPQQPAAQRPRCGGIAGIDCPAAQWCHYTARYPDAMGICRPNGECDAATDCERQELVHAMCVGAWACRNHACAWVCS